MTFPQRLPAGWAARLDTVEGTLQLGWSLPSPLHEPPSTRVTLIEDETPSKAAIRIEIDEDLLLHWVRQAPSGEPNSVAVDLGPLRGATHLDFYCTWSPFRMALHVVNRHHPARFVTTEERP